MRYSQILLPTTRETPAEAEVISHQLLLRGGFIRKLSAGVYTFLPLGLMTLQKVTAIVREEMNRAGALEILMPMVQPGDLWMESGRWQQYGPELLRFRDRNDRDCCLGPTHEEVVTDIARRELQSYRQLPVNLYQIQTKYRDEIRPRFGLMRGREFLMKDLYSFSVDEAQHSDFYDHITKAYLRIFARLGLGDLTYKTFASGGSFAKYSHEFQTISPVGEDTIYVSDEKGIAINEEVFNDEVLEMLGISRDELRQEKAVEVGNIFTLGYKYSEPLDLKFTDQNGEEKLVFMGSYGIGPSRVMGLIAEHFSDEKGLIWPENVAPFKVYLVQIGEKSVEKAGEIYEKLNNAGIEVLYDDRAERPGKKFADAELMGIPYRLTVSDRLLDGGEFELVSRANGETEMVSSEQIIEKMK